MKILLQKVYVPARHVVQVGLDRAAHVLLLDEANFNSYISGLPHQYFYGDFFPADRPAVLRPPFHDVWHVVIDDRNSDGPVNAWYSVTPG